MNKKLITLMPLGAYYFGGEHSFPVGKKDENPLASYIIESNLFPQQTSLLGMLRFLLLRNAGSDVFKEGRIQNSEKAKALIGPESFQVGKNTSSDFGKIIHLDFCFLQQQDGTTVSDILPVPLDYQLKVTFGEEKAYCNGCEKLIPQIEKYSPKEGLPGGYLNLQTKQVLREEDIFIKDQRIGINRDIVTGTTADSALFKQVRYQLKEGFRFAFMVELAPGCSLPANAVVELGGDSSKFLLETHDVPVGKNVEYPQELIGGDSEIYKLILLSDSLILNEDVNQETSFAITAHTPFNFLNFSIETTDYKLSKGNLKKSVRYSLFAKRSVFYFQTQDKLNSFINKINNAIFKQIGYNQYQTLKK